MKSGTLFSKLYLPAIVASFCLSAFVGKLSYSQTATVPPIAETPCDPLYYESLSARAWLEAEREITQNQNIILKPDSVLEYTCFDRLLDELAAHAFDMLSETEDYDQPLSDTSMDEALQNLLGEAIIAYIDGNYGSKSSSTDAYNLLGGHIAGTGIYHTPEEIDGSKVYSCDIMQRVWNAAKCINFISYREFDAFYTFQEYADATEDKRHLPVSCSSIQTNWQTNLTTALTSGPWTNDPLETYFELTDAQACAGTTCPCSGSPIPTGVRVYRPDETPAEYNEHVCLQPGCRFVPSGALIGGSAASADGCYGR